MAGLCSIATASPPLKLTQKQALKFILKRFKTSEGAKALYKRIFTNESIRERRFCLDRLEDILDEDLDRINRRYEKWAVKLSTQSLLKALSKAKLKPQKIDFLAVSTCTGYLCPGLASRLIETCKLRRDVHHAEVVGMGCGGSIPTLEASSNFLKANPGSHAASVSTEICSAAIYSEDSPELIISNALFADGSATGILKNVEQDGNHSMLESKPAPPHPVISSFTSITYPEWRESLRFTTKNGRLRNVLNKEVPPRSGEAMRTLTEKILRENNLKKKDIKRWIFHGGGEKILESVQDSLNLDPSDLKHSRETLKRFGNLSSASVLFTLHSILETPPLPRKGELGILASFGAGFSAHGCLIRF